MLLIALKKMTVNEAVIQIVSWAFTNVNVSEKK